ncbi:MAG TPA: hypothetical protein VF454_00955, partial [Gemmatimonadales bacterium]
MLKRALFAALLVVTAAAPQRLSAQAARGYMPADSTRLDVTMIYSSPWFSGDFFGPARWLGQGESYTTLERATAPAKGMEMVKYETATGTRTVLIPADKFIP